MLLKILIYIIFFVCGFISCLIFNALHTKKIEPNGKIILDHNENGDERICFALNLEYDDFKNYSTLIFEVENKM